MLVSYKYNFAFIHVYKVAGTSVRDALKKYTEKPLESSLALMQQSMGMLPKPEKYGKHIKAKELQDVLGARRYNEMFTFAFVRSPWDWQISLYEYMLRAKKHKQHQLIKSMSGFDEYIKWRVFEDLHFQKEFVLDETGKVIVDFIGRYENLQADFQQVCDKIGIKEELGHLNQTSSRSRTLADYYNRESFDLVTEYFKEDIEFFNYSVPVFNA